MNQPRIAPRVPSRPSSRLEKLLSLQHADGGLVAGVDEAGRGPLAGPVVAAVVLFQPDCRRPTGLDDSKKLKPAERERLYAAIQRTASSYGIGVATPQEIDLLNILDATRLAARRALAQLTVKPALLVTDCLELPGSEVPVIPIIKGDAICSSISAASILAKVTRDRMMADYAAQFPEYNWAGNKGYPTPDHYAALQEYGPCTLHRLSFSGVTFFDREVRWSPLGLRLRERAESSHSTESRLALRSEITSLAAQLPPLEVAELLALLP